MKTAIVVFPGSNCDRDAQVALRAAAGSEPAMIWHKEREIPAVDLIVLPGGFAYGDYLRCGAIAARSPAMETVRERAEQGVAVLGICNGFQVLTEAGLLPGALMRNADLKYHCHDVRLRVEAKNTPFTAGLDQGESVVFPIAHGDGNYAVDEETLARLEEEDRIAFRYVDAADEPSPAGNPNGSLRNIAGVLDERRRVLGLMPHPERLADPLLGGDDGARFFKGLVEALS